MLKSVCNTCKIIRNKKILYTKYINILQQKQPVRKYNGKEGYDLQKPLQFKYLEKNLRQNTPDLYEKKQKPYSGVKHINGNI